MNTKISVIIPAHNAAATIATQLEALSRQDYSEPFEIIVSDNASTDGTIAVVKQYQQKLPHLRIVEATARQGPSHARNVGVSSAQGEFILFCDADDEVAPGWVAALSNALSQHDIVGGYCDYAKLNTPFWTECLGDIEGNGIMNSPFLPFVGTNNMGIRKAVHEAIGGFDESLRAVQDLDYAWRAQQSGYTLHEAKDAIVYFRFRSSVKANFRRWWRFGQYSILVYRKHQPKGCPRWLAWKGLLSTAAIPVKFLLHVRDRVSLVRWWLNCAWCFGYVQGWCTLGLTSPDLTVQPPLSTLGSSTSHP